MNEIYFKRKVYSILNDNKFDREINNLRSGKVDFKTLPKVAVGSDRVFKQRYERKGKFYSVVLLVDMSGSMGYGKMELAAQSVGKVYDALRNADIEVCVMGFNAGIYILKPFGLYNDATGRDIEMHIQHYFYNAGVVELDPELCKETGCSIGTKTNARSYNADFFAVRKACKQLMARKGNKLLMVYSDGEPASPGSINDTAMLKKEVSVGLRAGIDILSVGILDGSVEEYYPYFKVVNDLDEIYQATVDLMSKHIRRF